MLGSSNESNDVGIGGLALAGWDDTSKLGNSNVLIPI
jgi:hypothetical protein